MLTCQHAGEEHGWEVVVEVEDPAHQEEREVMEHPAEQELTASLQQDLGQPWTPSSTAWSAAREEAETPALVQLCPFLAGGLDEASASLIWSAKQAAKRAHSSWTRGAAGPREPRSHRLLGEASAPTQMHQTAAGDSPASKAKMLHGPQTAAPTPRHLPHLCCCKDLCSGGQGSGEVRDEGGWDRGGLGPWLFTRELHRVKRACGKVSGAVVPTPLEDKATEQRATEKKRWAALYRA